MIAYPPSHAQFNHSPLSYDISDQCLSNIVQGIDVLTVLEVEGLCSDIPVFEFVIRYVCKSKQDQLLLIMVVIDIGYNNQPSLIFES